MTTSMYLGQVERIDNIIANSIEELKRLDLKIHGIGSINYDKLNVQTSGDKDIIGASVAMFMDEAKELQDLIRESSEMKKTIKDQINSIPNTYRYNLLFKKFILCETTEEIAQSIPCSTSTVKKSISRAMDTFEEMYGSTYLNEKPRFYGKKNQKAN